MELLETVEGFIKDMVYKLDGGEYINGLVDDIQKGKTTPQNAADEIISRLNVKFSKVENRGKYGL